MFGIYHRMRFRCAILADVTSGARDGLVKLTLFLKKVAVLIWISQILALILYKIGKWNLHG